MTIIAIIGPDGCGKTTQARMLVNRLSEIGCNTIYIHPTFLLLNVLTLSKSRHASPVSPRRAYTSQMNSPKKLSIQRMSMGLLGYLYALATYVYIKLYLDRSRMVVCDRYFYQFFFDLFGKGSEKIARFFPKPDVAFLLDADLDVFYSRMISSFDASVSRDYYTDVIDLYRTLSQKICFHSSRCKSQ
ncbi:Thymidylate kinase [Methanophagales archaeon]|nr:Thymidylate kinase [Methanophagales archaeon]